MTDIITQDNTLDKVDINRLAKLKKIIETLNKTDHIEIAIILKNNNEFMNENSNGLFINLNKVKETTIKQIEYYVEFVKNQENLIKKQEIIKENIENIYFKNVNNMTNVETKDIVTNTTI